jgi:hypothetical protein
MKSVRKYRKLSRRESSLRESQGKFRFDLVQTVEDKKYPGGHTHCKVVSTFRQEIQSLTPSTRETLAVGHTHRRVLAPSNYNILEKVTTVSLAANTVSHWRMGVPST